MTTAQTALCGNTTLGLFDEPLGPCVREQDHAHLFHRDERGTEWRRRTDHHLTAGKIYPPWTPDQVTTLNDYQRGDVWHPFTCGNYDCEALLVAHTNGWQCATGCGYTQNWAHAFMANRDTWNIHRFTARPVSAEEERIATERAVKMAEQSREFIEWFKVHSSPDPEVAALREALRETLEYIATGHSSTNLPADYTRWRALIWETP